MDIKKAVAPVNGNFTPNQKTTAAGNGSTNSIPIASPVITNVTVSQLLRGVKDRDGQYYILNPKTGELNKSVELLDAERAADLSLRAKILDRLLSRQVFNNHVKNGAAKAVSGSMEIGSHPAVLPLGRYGKTDAGETSGEVDPFPQ